ncbi:hypothetical protein N7486_006597 [Penicillium sp. IBT 16267x]|nr:hypothetical protein N7486_006597 [Penicillium sp. IBT 16267x]
MWVEDDDPVFLLSEKMRPKEILVADDAGSADESAAGSTVGSAVGLAAAPRATSTTDQAPPKASRRSQGSPQTDDGAPPHKALKHLPNEANDDRERRLQAETVLDWVMKDQDRELLQENLKLKAENKDLKKKFGEMS